MPQTSPPTPVPPRPRLERPREDRLISGVCSGLGRHLGLDVNLVRAVTVILALIGGAGLLVYLVVLALVPEEGRDQPLLRSGQLDEDDRAPLILGALVLGVVIAGVGPLPWGWFDGGPWLLVLGLGGLLVWWSARHDRSAVTAGASSTAGAASSTEPTATTATISPLVTDAPASTSTTEPPTTEMASGDPLGDRLEDDTLVHPVGEEPPPAPPRRPRVAGRVATGAVLVLLGLTGLLLSAFDVDVAWDTGLAIGVMACGLLAVLAAPFGGARGVVVLGFLVALVGGLVAASDIDLHGGIGERVERPRTATDIPVDGYRLAIGATTVDLREVTFPFGTTVVRVRQGIGEIVVRVPAGVAVTARGEATGGELDLLGIKEDGGEVDLEVDSPTASDRRVVIDADIGFGAIDVRQDGVTEGVSR